ncbi:hypothetical protein DW195_00305 [Collinsella sp. AM17-1]|nr:hypothetical protein DW195_00305 [Collinsella sp. AM17-1]
MFVRFSWVSRKANPVLSLGALVLADKSLCIVVDRALPIGSAAAKHLARYGCDVVTVVLLVNKEKILMAILLEVRGNHTALSIKPVFLLFIAVT